MCVPEGLDKLGGKLLAHHTCHYQSGRLVKSELHGEAAEGLGDRAGGRQGGQILGTRGNWHLQAGSWEATCPGAPLPSPWPLNCVLLGGVPDLAGEARAHPGSHKASGTRPQASSLVSSEDWLQATATPGQRLPLQPGPATASHHIPGRRAPGPAVPGAAV